MEKRHAAECFQKSVFESSNFLTDIWHDSILDHLRVINDFVQKKSQDSKSLTIEKIRKICKNNAQWSIELLNEDVKLDDTGTNITKQNGIQDVTTTCSKDEVPMFNSPWSPEIYITDDLLDSFDIPPGNKRKRLIKLKSNSEIMYHYLCYCIGTERIVKLRRWFIHKKFLKNVINGLTFEVSGSKAEGLDMKGSDTDLMVIPNIYDAAYENTASNVGPITIQYTSLDLSPGYVLVEQIINGKYIPVSNSIFKDFVIQYFRDAKIVYKTTKHGPSLSLSMAGYDMDIVLTFRCKTWPEIANEWIVRERKFGWPSQEMINYIVHQGCCIVPVGFKTSPENDNEWRLSFSLAEKDLIFSFNHTQLLVYGLLKLILKEIINTKHEVSELLCSYFLKTTLFWIIEETPASVWKPEFILLCYHLCLERLIQFIAEENCPNYFVRINNMFAGRISPCGKEKLLEILFDISHNRFNWILESKTMNKLSYFTQDQSKLHDLKRLQKTKDLSEISTYILDLIRFSKHLVINVFGMKLSVFMPLLKSMLKVPIIRISLRQELCHYVDIHRIPNNNKKANSLQKLHLFLLCSGCNSDLAAGKLMLASWLYNMENIHESLELADLALEFSKYRMYHFGERTTTKFPYRFRPNKEDISEVYLIQTLLRFTTTDVTFFYTSCLIPNEITCVVRSGECFLDAIIHSNLIALSFLPECYSHFLRFLCLNKLGQRNRSHDALLEIQRVKPIGCKFEQILSLCLNSLLRIIGNIVENQNENEWKNPIIIASNGFYNFPASSFKGLNIFTLASITQYFENFGLDPAFYQTLMSLCRIS